MKFETEQEEFWAGEFGTSYIERNKSKEYLASNLYFFSNALKSAHSIKNGIEFGANIGMNLKALKLLFPNSKFKGIEINKNSADILGDQIGKENVIHESILEYIPIEKFDFVLIKGVLIHINPDKLQVVYKKLYESADRYILIAEYYNPSPVTINYRGHDNKLFKRDFAGELLDKYADLRLVDYGFSYVKDPKFPQDDITWFLLEKSNEL